MEKEIDFSCYTSIKIGPVKNVRLIENIEILQKDIFLIGGGNNLLISPNPPPLAMLSKKFDFIKENSDTLHVGAATLSGKLLSYAKKHNIGGFELLYKLPGTLGGIVKMNAGLKEFCISDNLKSVLTRKGWLEKKDIDFSYRNSNIGGVIYEILFEKRVGFDYKKLEIFKNMRKNQPSKPSAGSCFKNPQNDYAGRLLELVGFKGKKIGNVAFSDVHSNFLVNLGGGTYDDAITLIKEAQKAVLEKFDVKLELEIKIV
ncbi:MAG: UDP-N-acetylmuramate dehydrogenase [Campylobacteraceae bacterium]|jgi:UDP-N-acetylmuramate dehydrogenase|nr:UDP-N-acetylmuramate dehydrogenase [Campylobacteraceae bacterium]